MGQGTSEAPTAKEEATLAELQRDDLGVRRRRALLAELGHVGGDRSIGALRTGLYHADLKTRVEAVLALGRIASDKAIDVLSEFVRRQKGPPFALAVRSLWAAKAHRALPTLIEILQERRGELGESDKRVIIHALAHMPHRSQVPVLAGTLTDKSFLTRRVAAMALSRIRAPESRAALQDAARSLSWLSGLPVRSELRRRTTYDGDG